MENKQVTLQTIADMAHVSKALVSRVLNNREVRVSAEKGHRYCASLMNWIIFHPGRFLPTRQIRACKRRSPSYSLTWITTLCQRWLTQ